jgi:hypothetical protein
LTLDAARKLARTAFADVAGGKDDPAAEKAARKHPSTHYR